MEIDKPTGSDGPREQDVTIRDRLFSRRATLAVGLYHQDIHPGLISGVAFDDKYRKFTLDKTIFGVTGSLIVGFVLWGILSPESVAVVSGAAFACSMEIMGWLLNAAMGVGLFVMLYVAFSKYGKIRLGKDHEKPEFSRFSWIAMMFGAGLGV